MEADRQGNPCSFLCTQRLCDYRLLTTKCFLSGGRSWYYRDSFIVCILITHSFLCLSVSQFLLYDLFKLTHTPSSLSHTVCKPSYFKPSVSSKFCQVCPDNTKPSAAGATECQCEEGFFRSPSDPPTSPCSGNHSMSVTKSFSTLKAGQELRLTLLCHLLPPKAPPSAPRDLSATTLSAEGRMQLSWSPPLVTGGRSDLTYSVVCELCDEASCVPCGEKIRFEPGPTDLEEPAVIVTDLDSHLNYTFTVESHSGVSHFGTERQTVSITTALDYTG